MNKILKIFEQITQLVFKWCRMLQPGQTDRSDQRLFQYLLQYEYYYIVICILVATGSRQMMTTIESSAVFLPFNGYIQAQVVERGPTWALLGVGCSNEM